MEVTYLDLKEKEVINVFNGKKLGRIMDIVFDSTNGSVLGLVVPGDKKIFRKGDDVFIPLDKIKRIGNDVILVGLQTENFYSSKNFREQPKQNGYNERFYGMGSVENYAQENINSDTAIINTMSASSFTGSSSPEENGFTFGTVSILMLVTFLFIVVALIAIFAARFGLFAVVIAISMLFNSFLFLILMVLMPSIEIGIAGVLTLSLGIAIIYTFTFIFAENVKKQYDLGKSFRASLETAFKKSLPNTIISNLALFISALIIFAFSFGELTSAIVIFAICMALSLITNLLIIPLLVKVGISFRKIDTKLFKLPKRAIGFESIDDDAKEED